MESLAQNDPPLPQQIQDLEQFKKEVKDQYQQLYLKATKSGTSYNALRQDFIFSLTQIMDSFFIILTGETADGSEAKALLVKHQRMYQTDAKIRVQNLTFLLSAISIEQERLEMFYQSMRKHEFTDAMIQEQIQKEFLVTMDYLLQQLLIFLTPKETKRLLKESFEKIYQVPLDIYPENELQRKENFEELKEVQGLTKVPSVELLQHKSLTLQCLEQSLESIFLKKFKVEPIKSLEALPQMAVNSQILKFNSKFVYVQDNKNDIIVLDPIEMKRVGTIGIENAHIRCGIEVGQTKVLVLGCMNEKTGKFSLDFINLYKFKRIDKIKMDHPPLALMQVDPHHFIIGQNEGKVSLMKAASSKTIVETMTLKKKANVTILKQSNEKPTEFIIGTALGLFFGQRNGNKLFEKKDEMYLLDQYVSDLQQLENNNIIVCLRDNLEFIQVVDRKEKTIPILIQNPSFHLTGRSFALVNAKEHQLPFIIARDADNVHLVNFETTFGSSVLLGKQTKGAWQQIHAEWNTTKQCFEILIFEAGMTAAQKPTYRLAGYEVRGV